ncbi:Pyruvate synthase subunit PorD [subsurface metagenome]
MKKGWKELPIGTQIIKPGSSEDFKTGDWRIEKPIIDFDKCIHCLICWIYCPDSSIYVNDNKVTGINYDFCKGCAICVEECPKDAITMQSEVESE